jgi:hypothetical protein
MKILLSLLTLGAVATLGLSSAAAEEAVIIYSASAKKNPFVAASSAAGVLEAKNYSAPVRAQHDSNVYRSEGRASARHDEISSYVISLHINLENPRTVYLGHSLAR